MYIHLKSSVHCVFKQVVEMHVSHVPLINVFLIKIDQKHIISVHEHDLCNAFSLFDLL